MRLIWIVITSLLFTNCVNQELKELQDIVFSDDAQVKKKIKISKKKIKISKKLQKRTLASIIKHINQDKLLEAEGLLNAAIKSNSFTSYKSDLYFLKSSILVISHFENKAITFLEKGLEIEPTNKEAQELYLRITGQKYLRHQLHLASKDRNHNDESLGVNPLNDLLSRIRSNDFDTDSDFTLNIDEKNPQKEIIETIRSNQVLAISKPLKHRTIASDPLFANEDISHPQKFATLMKPKLKTKKTRTHTIKKKVKRKFHLAKKKEASSNQEINQPLKPTFNNNVIIIDETELD